MRNLKFIIAGLVLGLMASCTADNMEDDCGCKERSVQRVATLKSYEAPPSALEMDAWRWGGSIPSKKPKSTTKFTTVYSNEYSSWIPIGCSTPGFENEGSGLLIETKCE